MMLNRILFTCLLAFVIILSACSKKEEAPTLPEYYMTANVGGETKTYSEDAVDNCIFITYASNPESNTLSITKYAAAKARGYYLQVAITRFNLDNINTPYEVPEDATSPNPYFSVTFGNQEAPNQGTPNDDTTFFGSTLLGSDVSVTITDKTDDIIEGTFEGTLKTPSGKVTTVTDGKFRAKISRLNH